MRRKYLIIAMNMADLAAGIVFKRLIGAMTKYVDCDVICPQMDDKLKKDIDSISCPQFNKHYFYYQIDNWSYKKNGIKTSEVLWANITYYKLAYKIKKRQYDAIISFIYNSNMAPLVLGQKLSIKANRPWIVYTVDAVPDPLGWNPNVTLRNKRIKVINKYIPRADALFAANSKMLDYELGIINGFKGFTGVVYTPSDLKKESTEFHKDNTSITFLYAGQVYQMRKIGSLLKGFEQLLALGVDAKLIFVGSSKLTDFAGFEHLIEIGRIERHGFTNNIEDFYQNADILIDINGDVEHDVFLSSKVCNYLSYDKPIVAISHDESPVRSIMNGCKTILHSHHNSQEIFECLKEAICLVDGDFSEREKLRSLFSPQEVAKLFCNNLNEIVSISNGKKK